MGNEFASELISLDWGIRSLYKGWMFNFLHTSVMKYYQLSSVISYLCIHLSNNLPFACLNYSKCSQLKWKYPDINDSNVKILFATSYSKTYSESPISWCWVWDYSNLASYKFMQFSISVQFSVIPWFGNIWCWTQLGRGRLGVLSPWNSHNSSPGTSIGARSRGDSGRVEQSCTGQGGRSYDEHLYRKQAHRVLLPCVLHYNFSRTKLLDIMI